MVRHYCDVCGRGIPFAQLDSGYRVTILRADKRKEEEWAEVCGVCVEDLKRWVSSRRPSGTEEEDEEDPDPPGDTDTIERVVRAAIQHVVPDQVPVTERGWIRWNDFEGWRKSRLKSRGKAFNDPPTIDD